MALAPMRSKSSSSVGMRVALQTPASPSRRSNTGGKRRGSRAHTDTVRLRESAAIQAFLQRQDFMQPSDLQQRERRSLRTEALSRSQILPPLPASRGASRPASPREASMGDVPMPAIPSSPNAVASPQTRIASQRLCGFSPSEQSGIDMLLQVLDLGPEDAFYDLGCGDGRVVTSVVQRFGCRGIGIDVNGILIKQATARAEKLLQGREPLERVSFLHQDISLTSLADASAIYIYMPQDALHTLMSKVLPGTGLRDGTLVFTEEYWPQSRAALRHVRHKNTYWEGKLHCYEWREAYGLRERGTL